MPFPILVRPIAEALVARGYEEPTPVQEAVLVEGAVGRDLLVSAQTGSGKTIAYGLAIVETLLGTEERLPPAREPLALVVAPTRELAMQVQRELEWLYAGAGATIVNCVGGMDPRAEQRRLQEGAHIVVGTPGRLRDHLERGRLKIAQLKALVLDEADEMLNLGFREDLEFILEATPSGRRTLLFSATLPKDIVTLARRYQRDALRIAVDRAASAHADIEYRAIRIAPNEMEHAVVNVLRHAEAPGAIVFCNTRETVRHLYSGLLERGFAAVSLSGELGQAERNTAMQALRDGRARVCVATDVAARGIDLPGLNLVVHAELPNDAETLQHRSGRTGRAGRKGVSVLLVPISRRRKAERLLSEARIQPTWGGAPSADDIRRLDEERMLSDPILTEAPSEDDIAVARQLLHNRTAEEVAAALARIYRLRLPAPEDVFDPGYGRDPKGAVSNDSEGRERAPKNRGPGGPTVWFHMDIGKRNNADPKWILPLLCRRGRVTRDEIGAIKIFERETKFEISEASAKKFAAAAEGTDADDITITVAEGGPPDLGKGGGFSKNKGGPRKPYLGRKPDGGPSGAPRGPGAPRGDRPPRSSSERRAENAPRETADGPRSPKSYEKPRRPKRPNA